MEKQKNTQLLIIGILAVALLTMSVGFATFTSTLNIAGNATLTGASWDIQFDNTSYSETTGSVNVPETARTISGTSITYNVTLSKPGEFYEFTINVLNKGTFDANLTGVTLSSLSETQSKYLKYTLTYDNTTYETTTQNLQTMLAKTNGTAAVKVRVEYVQPENSEDLPEATITIPLTASLTYVQAA